MPDAFSDWRKVTLNDVADLTPNSIVDGPFGSNLTTREYSVTGGVRLIQLQNIGEGFWIDENKKFISLQKFNELDRHAAYPGDIAIAKMADPVARACLIPSVSDKFLVVADCIKLRVNHTKYDSKYIVYAINSRDFRLQAEYKSSGTTRQRINLSVLKTIDLYIPSLPEQQRIAHILDTIDEQIQETERLLAKLKLVKAGLLHDLLTRGIDEHGDVRDPVAHPEQFKDSPLGGIPREWDVSTLAGVAQGKISNGIFKKPEKVGSGYPLVNVLDLYSDFGINIDSIERLDVSEREARRFFIQSGDCFFTRSSLNLAGIAHCNIIREVSEHALFESHVMRVRPDKSQVIPEFLAYWCRSSWARKYFMRRAKQVTMTTISQPDISPLPIPLPSKCEQNQIVTVLNSHDARIADEEEQLAKLRKVKRGLMHDLLTGRVRVSSLHNAME